MEDKKQYEIFREEFLKATDALRDAITDFGERLSKLLPDIEIPDEEEDTWEMKCPYKDGNKTWHLYSYGDVDSSFWFNSLEDNARFKSGNTFPTKEAAELETKRRKLLTRFRSFRDKCNGDWKPDWKNVYENKYFICKVDSKLEVYVSSIGNSFAMFGFFKNSEDCERAIELFGDEIKELFVECDA